MICITIASFVTIYVHTDCWSLFAECLVVHRLRKRYFRSLLWQETAFFDSLPAGEVSTRLTDDIETIRAGTFEKVGNCVSTFSYSFGAYAVAFGKNARLAGMLVSPAPAYFLWPQSVVNMFENTQVICQMTLPPPHQSPRDHYQTWRWSMLSGPVKSWKTSLLRTWAKHKKKG